MLRQRPENFILKKDHALARGLVFAGLGRSPRSVRYTDSSSYGRHGTLTNMEVTDWVWVPSLNRFALDFDGSNEFVTANATGLVLPFTVSTWMYLPSEIVYAVSINESAQDDRQCFIGHRSEAGVGFYIRYDDNFAAGGVGNSAFAASWYHVCGVAHSTALRYAYVNGVEYGPNTTAKTHPTVDTLDLGRIGDSTPTYTDSRVSDVLLHSRVLSLSEIKQLADPSNVMLSGLIQPPKRKYYALRTTTYSSKFFSFKTPFGSLSLRS